MNSIKLGLLFLIIFFPSLFFIVSRQSSQELQLELYGPDEVEVPILMFHRVREEIVSPSVDVTPAQFREFILAMKDEGFTPVSFKELEAYVNGKGNLPKKPFVITFDDGYLCNFELAFPILLELKVPANINIIGSRRGADTYMERPSTPHFTWENAAEMFFSGLIEIGSHSFEMHGSPGRTIGRIGVVPLDGEPIEDFIYAFKKDLDLFYGYFYTFFGEPPRVFAYPFGWASEVTERILYENGYTVTLLTGESISTVYRNDPSSLFGLKRINVSGDFSNDDLIRRVSASN